MENKKFNGLEPNDIVMVSYADLVEFFQFMMEKDNKKNTPSPLITEDAACELLNVKRVTLWRWAKNGLLAPIKLGKRNMYKQSDIDKLTKEN